MCVKIIYMLNETSNIAIFCLINKIFYDFKIFNFLLTYSGRKVEGKGS